MLNVCYYNFSKLLNFKAYLVCLQREEKTLKLTITLYNHVHVTTHPTPSIICAVKYWHTQSIKRNLKGVKED